jgi:hypothetical protein
MTQLSQSAYSLSLKQTELFVADQSGHAPRTASIFLQAPPGAQPFFAETRFHLIGEE